MRLPTKFLVWATALLFIGWAWLAFFFDLPFRELLWNEALLAKPLAGLGVEWAWWVSSQGVNAYLPGVQKLFGGLFMLSALATCLPSFPWRRFWVRLGAILSTLVLFCGWPGHFYQVGYLLEIALRAGTPFLLLYQWRQGETRVGFHTARWLIAATFIGHGLYAMGFYPRPASFVNWTSAGLNISENAAIQVLILVGILDIVAAVLLLLPRPRWALPLSLAWLIPWAILTTLARYWSSAAFESWDYLMLRWTPEVLLRGTHVLVVFGVWWGWRFLRVYRQIDTSNGKQ